MGAVDARSVADFEPSVIDENLTAAEDGDTVSAAKSRGECFLVDINTAKTSGDITVSFQERDPGGSFTDVADEDLDFGGSSASSNGFTLSGVSSETRERVGYTGQMAELRVVVDSVANAPDFEAVMGVIKYMPRRLYDFE